MASEMHDDLADLICDLLRKGGVAAVDAHVAAHPAEASEIRRILPSLMLLEGLAREGGAAGSAESVPSRIGDFEILRELGRGGMGVVYEAIQLSLDRRVALKVLPRQTFEDEVQVERFRREARAAARLRHDHIVPVYGISSHEGLHFYVMQYIEGHGLDQVIADLRRQDERAEATEKLTAAVSAFYELNSDPTAVGSGGSEALHAAAVKRRTSPVPVDRSNGERRPQARSVARLGIQVAGALAHAHGEGLLHRDIKPSNLLLDAEGRCWVTDFGLAKDDQADDLTHSGEIVGTLRYMAPERFRGWADPRSDTYAVGLVLYELLVLRPAFVSTDRPALIREILDDQPVPLRRLDPSIPRDLETVVLKAIEKEPGRRYATARDLAADLNHFLEGRPLSARRVGPAGRALKWVRRHPAPTAMILLALIATGVFVGTKISHARELERSLDRVRAESRRADEKARELEAALTEVRAAQVAAENEHQNARKFFDRLSVRVAEELGNLPTADSAREKILGDVLAWYRDRLALRSNDPKLVQQTAEMLQALARIEQSIGQADEAFGHLNEALSLLGNRDDGDLRVLAATLLGNLGRLEGQAGKMKDAARTYELALAKIDAELQLRPGDRTLARNKAELLNNLARTVTLIDKPAALGYQERAVATMRSLLDAGATTADRRQFATLASNLAIDLHLLGRSNEALQSLAEALAEVRRIPDDDDSAEETETTLSIIYVQRALVVHESGASGDAIADYEKALELMGRLVDRHPERLEHRARRAQALNNLAVVFLNLDRTGRPGAGKKARELLDAAIADLELLQRSSPDPEFALSLARSLGNFARQTYVDPTSSGAQIDLARSRFERALALLQSAAPLDDARIERFSLGSNMALLGFIAGRKDEAARDLDQLVADLPAFIADLGSRSEVKHIAAGILNNQAETLLDRDRLEDAALAVRRGLELEEEILKASPEAPESLLFKKGLLMTLARARLRQGRHAEAMAAVERLEDLLDDEPSRRFVLGLIGEARRLAAADQSVTAAERDAARAEYRAIGDRINTLNP